MRADTQRRKERKGNRRERERVVSVDFTVMINRHRILIVLGLDGWGPQPQPGLVFRSVQRAPARLIH